MPILTTEARWYGLENILAEHDDASVSQAAIDDLAIQRLPAHMRP